jgi:glycosyltransferase involved in cell wall biosynthesis
VKAMSDKKRIAFFIPSMTGGGAERVALNLIKEFSAQGWAVDLILNHAGGVFLPLVPDTVRVIPLNTSSFFSKVNQIAKYLRSENPQFLISLLDRVNVCGFAKVTSRSAVKVILSIHSITSEEFSENFGFLTSLKPYFMRFSYYLADAIVPVSQGVSDDLGRLLRSNSSKVKVIYNPIVSPEILSKAQLFVEHPWFSRQDAPVFLSVGRLSPAKDFPTLLKAFALVRQKMNAKLVVLGEGEERSNLEQLIRQLNIKDDVDLHGFVDNPYKYIANSSSFVLSSKYEGFGNVLVEALALGKPIVSTDCPSGPSEILDGGKYGKLVPVGDVDALALAMIESLSIDNDVQWAKARSEMFSTAQIAQNYMDLLNSLVI